MNRLLTVTSALMLAGAPALAQKPGDAQPQSAPASNIVVDVDFLIGLWSDQRDCSGSTIEFRRDGAFVNSNGTGGTWRLDGDRLSLTGTRTLTVRLVPMNNLELTVINADNTQGYSRRCIGPNRPMT